VAGLWLCIAQFDVPKQQEIDPAMVFSLYISKKTGTT
jgi:hypothetical protein